MSRLRKQHRIDPEVYFFKWIRALVIENGSKVTRSKLLLNTRRGRSNLRRWLRKQGCLLSRTKLNQALGKFWESAYGTDITEGSNSGKFWCVFFDTKDSWMHDIWEKQKS